MQSIKDLPSLLNGAESREQWAVRREEIHNILETEIYGRPVPVLSHRAVVTDTEDGICAGKGVRETYTLTFPDIDFSFPVEILRPIAKDKVPTFVFLNFRPDTYDKYLPTEEVLDRGYAVARIFYEEVTADNEDFTSGLAGALHIDRSDPTACGKIAMWAWAASRVMDLLETLPWVDVQNVAVLGHSRLGKTALLAGAYDSRFRYVFSNDSGCSGAAITRGKVGEQVSDICERFGYWFCENYKKYANNEAAMPFDQHFLLALTAPRILGVHSAWEDTWADPAAEYRACVAASPAWTIYGETGFVHPERLPMPGDDFAEGFVTYSLRAGTHFLSRWDWNRYMNVLDKFQKRAIIEE